MDLSSYKPEVVETGQWAWHPGSQRRELFQFLCDDTSKFSSPDSGETKIQPYRGTNSQCIVEPAHTTSFILGKHLYVFGRKKRACRLVLRRAHFPETNFQLEHPGEGFFSTLDSIGWGICQAAIHNSLQRLAVLLELGTSPSLAGSQKLGWCLITFFYTETEAILVHGFNYPKGSYSKSIANLWIRKALEKPDNKIDDKVTLCVL